MTAAFEHGSGMSEMLGGGRAHEHGIDFFVIEEGAMAVVTAAYSVLIRNLRQMLLVGIRESCNGNVLCSAQNRQVAKLCDPAASDDADFHGV
jgi:hypothetical protein